MPKAQAIYYIGCPRRGYISTYKCGENIINPSIDPIVAPPDLIVSPVRSTYGGYYGLVVVPPRPRPRPQTLHRSHDNLKNPYRIASIFYM